MRKGVHTEAVVPKTMYSHMKRCFKRVWNTIEQVCLSDSQKNKKKKSPTQSTSKVESILPKLLWLCGEFTGNKRQTDTMWSQWAAETSIFGQVILLQARHANSELPAAPTVSFTSIQNLLRFQTLTPILNDAGTVQDWGLVFSGQGHGWGRAFSCHGYRKRSRKWKLSGRLRWDMRGRTGRTHQHKYPES